MFFNNLKISFRHLVKDAGFSLINIFGLTLGFLCFMLIALYLHDELNFDRMHPDADRIYRVIQEEQLEGGESRRVASVAARIGPESARQFPGITAVCRIAGFGRLTIGNDPETRGYEQLVIADANFFQFFNFPLLQGDPATCLTAPNGIVISKKLAIRYFGTPDALNKTVWIDGDDMYVTGVMDDFPSNSHLSIDLMWSQATVDRYWPEYRQFETSDWSRNSFATYIKTDPLLADNLAVNITNLVGQNYPVDKAFKSRFYLQPMKDIHLYSTGIQDYQVNLSGFNPFYIYLFSAVAFLILLIAALNYMNLSTAAAFQRTREIGTRKTLGAGKGLLIVQFLGESLLLALASILLATAILQVLLPMVNQFTNKNLQLYALPSGWILMMAIALVGSALLAALYPAFVIAGVAPVQAIKKEIRFASKSIPIRKILVVAQFVISIIMISSTLIIYRQLNFIREKELGFEADNLVTIDINSGALRRQFESVKTELSKIPHVQSVTVSSRVPGEWKIFPIASVSSGEQDLKQNMIFVGIDQGFLETYKIKLLEGRNFSTSPSDSTKVMLTQLAVSRLGLENPIGQVITIPQAAFGGRIETLQEPFRAEIIGIVEDFHFESIRKEMMPTVFAYHNNPIHSIDYYTIKVETRYWNETLTEIRKVNASFDPVNPVEYNFLDSKIDEFYKNDDKRGQIFLAFSLVIVMIACMGLFALVSFAVENRKKEIGIRKVLGASVESIVSLLSKEFLVLVVIAFIIATPLVVVLMNNWLSEFAYHVDFGVGTFIVSGVISIIIAMTTISVKSISAAVGNPVDSLRSE